VFLESYVEQAAAHKNGYEFIVAVEFLNKYRRR